MSLQYGVVDAFTEPQRSQQPLLLDRTIIVPPYVDTDFYKEMIWALSLCRSLFPDEPIKLHISGYGGDADLLFGIMSLIKKDGNVEGHLIGGAHSCHAVLWAACQKRFVYSYAMLGIHSIQEGRSVEHYTAKTYQQLREHIMPYDIIVASVLSEACHPEFGFTPAYWLDMMQNQVTPPLTFSIEADKIVNKYGMGVAY